MEINGEHKETPKLPDYEQWTDPEIIETPRIWHKETGRIFKVAEINFAAKYVTFIVEGEDFSFTDDRGATAVYPVGSLCMKSFDDILIE